MRAETRTSARPPGGGPRRSRTGFRSRVPGSPTRPGSPASSSASCRARCSRTAPPSAALEERAAEYLGVRHCVAVASCTDGSRCWCSARRRSRATSSSRRSRSRRRRTPSRGTASVRSSPTSTRRRSPCPPSAAEHAIGRPGVGDPGDASLRGTVRRAGPGGGRRSQRHRAVLRCGARIRRPCGRARWWAASGRPRSSA